MSAIFGLVHFDGRPVSRDAIEHLQRAHDAWGSERRGVWQQGPAALGVALRFSTLESRAEVVPMVDAAARTTVATIARLDNRDALCDTFQIPTAARASVPDGHLVRLAYERWGEGCPARLLGDWSLAVWHADERRLFLARDHLGSTGLYYAHVGPFLAFASSPEALALLPEVASPIDEWQVVRYLAIFPGEPDCTLWRNVRVLPPAHSLTAVDGSVRGHEYWRAEDVPDVRRSSTAEYVEGFLDLYRKAVAARLRSIAPVGATLSAGLDSSSVTALAAEALRRDGRRLTAFTSVPKYPDVPVPRGAVADEGPLAAEVARWCGNVDQVLVTADELSPVAALEQSLAGGALPGHAAANLGWLLSMLAAARDRGLGVLLVGQMGNITVSWNGGNAPSLGLWLQGRWRAGAREFSGWRSRRHASWAVAIRRQLITPLVMTMWMRAKRWRSPQSIWYRQGAIHPALAERLHLNRVLGHPSERRWRGAKQSGATLRRSFLAMTSQASGQFQHATGAAYGIDVRDPTADLRLTEYCFGLPAEQYADDRTRRLLVRRAMEGLLPPAVQWNVLRGQQSADFGWRLRHHAEEIESLMKRLDETRLAADHLDVARLRRIWIEWRDAPARQPEPEALARVLGRGLLVGTFLARYDRASRGQRPAGGTLASGDDLR